MYKGGEGVKNVQNLVYAEKVWPLLNSDGTGLYLNEIGFLKKWQIQNPDFGYIRSITTKKSR